MKVIIFGSTGTVGKHVVKQSLEKGHQVTAFGRDKNKLHEIQHENLNFIEGDVMKLADVRMALAQHDVVIVALGSGKSRKSVVRSIGTKNIITAMKAEGVQRLVCQSTLGTNDTRKYLNFFWKRIMFGWFLKKIYLDHELQEKYVRESNLNWTIVRPSAFTDGIKTGEYLHGFEGDKQTLKLKISRADVADFVVKQIGNKQYLHQSPAISN